MPYSTFQYANKKTITTGETWTSESFVNDIRFIEPLGSNVRTAVISVANPNNTRGTVYSAYQRVRLHERDTGHNIFLGRIDNIIQDQSKQEIILFCRDYTADLAEKTNPASSYTDTRRSEVVKDIINTDNNGVFGTGSGKNVTSSFHVDTSTYLEKIERVYGDGNDGYESLLDSVDKLATEEPWYPTAVLFWTGTLTAFSSEWFHLTAEALFGNEILLKPQFSHTGGASGKEMRMYVGSFFQFSGINFILEAASNNTNLDIEYWDGVTWTNVASAPNTPVVTDGTNDLEQNGNITWSDIPSDWATLTDLTGVEAADTFSISFRDDASVTTLAAAAPTNLYWIRFSIDRTDSTATPDLIYHLHLLDSNARALDSRWDYRIEDPFFFDVVGDGDGAGDWNTHTTNSYPSSSTTFNFLAATGRNFYFGADRKVAGIEFDLSTNGDYSNVTITWQYWNGASWSAITDDNSYGFAADGAVRFDTNALADWARADLILTSGGIEPSSVHGQFYYLRASVSGIPNTTAIINTIRTISIASFAFFERGTEPWAFRLQGTTSSHGGAVTRLVDNNATFTTDVIGKAVVNTTTSATTTVSSVVNATTLELSAGIFLTAGGQGYQIDFDKVEGLQGVKANDNIGGSWQGVTLQWRGTKADQIIPIKSYQLGEAPIETYTRVIVHGKDGARGTAVDTTRENTFGIVKEKVIYDWDLITPAACTTKAESILKYTSLTASTSIRRGIIEVINYPTYIYNGKPRAVRSGDVIRVTINDSTLSLTNERFLVWKIDYDDSKSISKLTVTQDLIPGLEDKENSAGMMQEMNKTIRNTSWNKSVPSGESVKSVIFHNTVGTFSPEARIIQNNQADDNEDRLDIDNYIGSGQTNTQSQGTVATVTNWSTAMSIFYARGGAMGFTGTTDAGEADINEGNGRIYYNQDDDLFKVRVEQDEVTDPTFRWLPVGEWGRATVTGGAGQVSITFQNQYDNKPQILLTVDQDTAGGSSSLFAEVDAWATSGGNYTGATFHAYTIGAGGSHSHDISLTRGGANNNVQVGDGGGTLYTGQEGGGTVTASTASASAGGASDAADSTEIMFLVLVTGPTVTSP